MVKMIFKANKSSRGTLAASIITNERTITNDDIHATLVYVFTRSLVKIPLYSVHFTIATYPSQAIRSRWKKDAQQPICSRETLRMSIVQITFTIKTLWIINESKVIATGIVTAPTKRSARATLDSRMFECFFNSLLVLDAIITKRFYSTVTGQAMAVMATITLKEVVSFTSQMYSGESGQ